MLVIILPKKTNIRQYKIHVCFYVKICIFIVGINFIPYLCRKFFVMKLEELEKKLMTLRKEEEVTYKMLRDRGLSRETVQNIHNGKDYNVSSLFKYLDSLMYVIEINGVIVGDIVSFGAVLQNCRKAFGYSLIKVQSELVWTARQVLAIEKGRGYTRKSLLKYTSVISADYNLMSVFDLDPDIRENLFKSTFDINK